jgi:uncharacterized protein YcfJ
MMHFLGFLTLLGLFMWQPLVFIFGITGGFIGYKIGGTGGSILFTILGATAGGFIWTKYVPYNFKEEKFPQIVWGIVAMSVVIGIISIIVFYWGK